MEASLASQLWRGARFCLSLLVGLTVLTVVFEDKGLGRGMLNSPDHRPEQVSNVRFSDVKGVDEAKVRPCSELCIVLRGGCMSCCHVAAAAQHNRVHRPKQVCNMRLVISRMWRD